MKSQDNDPQNSQTPQPVAYTKDGQPLFAHPPQSAPGTPQPQMVYMARPLEPTEPHISEAVKQKHEDSRGQYPYLNLSNGEYVISAIRRHPIGLVSIWAVSGLLTLVLLIGIPYILGTLTNNGSMTESGAGSLALILLMLGILTFLGGVIATIVYNANRFFLTNESVIQHIQVSLFSKKEQTISLANIEDASYRQHGIVQHLLNYGSLRLSTEGDETTYRFNYVAHPHHQLQLLNNAVEAFKNGRPFSDENN